MVDIPDENLERLDQWRDWRRKIATWIEGDMNLVSQQATK